MIAQYVEPNKVTGKYLAITTDLKLGQMAGKDIAGTALQKRFSAPHLKKRSISGTEVR